MHVSSASSVSISGNGAVFDGGIKTNLMKKQPTVKKMMSKQMVVIGDQLINQSNNCAKPNAKSSVNPSECLVNCLKCHCIISIDAPLNERKEELSTNKSNNIKHCHCPTQASQSHTDDNQAWEDWFFIYDISDSNTYFGIIIYAVVFSLYFVFTNASCVVYRLRKELFERSKTYFTKEFSMNMCLFCLFLLSFNCTIQTQTNSYCHLLYYLQIHCELVIILIVIMTKIDTIP